MYETEKTFDTIKRSPSNINDNINSFNITANMFSSQTTKNERTGSYLKTKRMSVEDLKSEIEKQRLHEILSKSIVRKTSLRDLAN